MLREECIWKLTLGKYYAIVLPTNIDEVLNNVRQSNRVKIIQIFVELVDTLAFKILNKLNFRRSM